MLCARRGRKSPISPCAFARATFSRSSGTAGGHGRISGPWSSASRRAKVSVQPERRPLLVGKLQEIRLGKAVCGRFAVPTRRRVLYVQEEDSPRRTHVWRCDNPGAVEAALIYHLRPRLNQTPVCCPVCSRPACSQAPDRSPFLIEVRSNAHRRPDRALCLLPDRVHSEASGSAEVPTTGRLAAWQAGRHQAREGALTAVEEDLTRALTRLLRLRRPGESR
jgi:hypothetical protein